MPSRSPAPRPEVERLREAVVSAGRRLGARGLIAAGEGNISVRLGGDSLLITPLGLRKDELAAADLVVVQLLAGGGSQAAETVAHKYAVFIHYCLVHSDAKGTCHFLFGHEHEPVP